MCTCQALSGGQDSPLHMADSHTGPVGYILHFPPLPRGYAVSASIGFSPAPDAGSALLVHNAMSVGVMVKELSEALARTRSLPAFSNPQNACAMTAGPEVSHEPSLFQTLHTKRCAKGWVWPEHNQTSILACDSGRGREGKAGTRRGKSPCWSLSQLAIVFGGQRCHKVIKFCEMLSLDESWSAVACIGPRT